ncbi:MAG: ATP-binding protein [Candidatus Krumholzibacteriales bacterium]
MIYLPETVSAAAAVLMVTLGTTVTLRSPEAAGKRLFAAASFSFAAISAAALGIMRSHQPETALSGLRLLMIFSFIATSLVISYFRSMGKESRSGKDRAFAISVIAAGFAAAILLIFIPASLFITRVHFFRDAGGLFWGITVSGWGKAGATIILLSNVYVLHRLENLFRSSNIPAKVAIKYPLLGIIITSLINFTVFSRLIAISILNRTHIAVLASGTIILATSWLYAVIRYQPLRITVRAFQPTSGLAVTLTGLYLISLSIISYISSILEVPFDSFTALLFALFGAFLVLATAISGKTRRRIRRFISDNFQTDRYNYRREWNRYSRIMNERNSKEDLLQNVIGSICESMLVSRGCICTSLNGSESIYYGRVPGAGCMEALRDLISSFSESEGILFFNKGGASVHLKKYSSSAEVSEAEWIRAVSVLGSLENPLGVIALGEKDTRARFVEEDRNFLKIVSEQLALALENFLLSERIIESDRIESFNRFASFVIHDLKNTLGMLSLTAENARDNIADPRFQKDAVEVLQRAVEKINNLISSLSAHRSPPEISRREMDIASFLDQRAGMLEEIARGRNIRLVISGEEGLRSFADPEAVEKIIENLVLNSVEASEEGSEVTLRAERAEDGWITLTVSDRGEGFQKEYFNNDLFKPFRSTKKNGLGIGLVMCKTLAEAHDGTIIIENRSSGGASVTLRIPGLERD